MSGSIQRWLLVALLGAGCYAGEVEVRGGGVVERPDLVDVAPGVQVIADYDEPIFFADGGYWWSVDGLWYRSGAYTGGWALVTAPPLVVLNIHEPLRWRHYHPGHYVVHRRPVPIRHVQRPTRHEPRADRTPRHDRR